jgi:putative PEP-CTERM system TPR-repeat lipoprotein
MAIFRNVERLRWLPLVLGALLIAACGRLDPEAELAEATASFEARDFRATAIRLGNVFQSDPDNLGARVLRAKLALVAGDFAAARDDLTRAAGLGASPDAVAPSLADALLRLGDHERALEVLVEAETALDALPDYWTLRAAALARGGRLDEAQRALDRGAELGPESSRSLIERASIAVQRNSPADAESLLTRAVESFPEDAEALSVRGNFYFRTGRSVLAISDLERAADLYGRSIISLQEATVLSALVQLYLAANDHEGASRAADRLATRAPNGGIAAYAQGLVAYQRGRFDEAAALLQGAVNARPDSAPLLTLLGAIHLALGNLGQAEQQLLRVLVQVPEDPAAIKLLAETRLRQQRPEAALESLRPLADLGADDVQIGLLSGIASLLTGNAEQGVLYLEQAAALNPSSQMIKLELARAYLAANREADAVELLSAAFGSGTGGANLSTNLMLLFAHVRSGDVEAGRALAASLAAQFPDEAPALTAAAAFHQLIGERQTAREFLETAVRADGAFVPARMLLASALIDEGRAAEAERHLREVLVVDGINVQAATTLAQLASARGAFDEAEALLVGSLEQAPAVITRLMLAQLHISRGRLAEAGRQIAAATEEAPDNAEVVATRGLLALAEGNAADAVPLLTRAEAQLPNRIGIALVLARAQIANGEPVAARDTLRRVVAAAPESLPLRAALGGAELALGNADEALTIAKALQSEFPRQSAGYLLEGDTRIAQRRYDAAIGSLELAFERQPTWEVLRRRVLAMQLDERSSDVERLISEWIEDNPEHVPGHMAMGMWLQAAGRNDAALTYYRRVIELDGANAAALNNAAWLVHSMGDEGALALAERAHAAAPDNPAVLDTLGWILANENREQDAIVYLERAAQLAPQALEIRYHVAHAQARLGRVDEAQATLESLLSDARAFEQREAARDLLESL